MDFEELYKFFDLEKSSDIEYDLAYFVALDEACSATLVISEGCSLWKGGEASWGMKADIKRLD